jgi:hypothetical protein
MKTNVNFSAFCDAFRDMDRNDQYTYEGKRALYDYLIELEESYDMEIELDVIAICCDFTEYSNADEAASEYFDYEGMTYGDEGEELDTPEEVEEKAIEYLQDRTSVIPFDSGIIIQDF